MVSIFALALLVFIYCIQRASALTCHKAAGGDFEFFDGTTKITPTTFPCMHATVETDSTLVVSPPVPSSANKQKCPAKHDNVRKWVPKYERVGKEVNPGVMCKYECREHAGEYRCKSAPRNKFCECEKKGLRVVIKPVSSEMGVETLLGQSETTGSQSCEGKEEGFQFPDAVPCISISADVRKKRVFKTNKKGKCLFRTETRRETRFTPAALTEQESLQGCMWVCKEAAPRCTTTRGNGKCDCQVPGLQKILVGMNEFEMNALMRQTGCVQHEDCGPCGVCKEGACELKKWAWEGNHCPCGMVCPVTDERKKTGGKLLCVPNTSLTCMADPAWKISRMSRNYRAGEEIPDFCREGDADMGDTCGCQDGFIRYWDKKESDHAVEKCKRASD